MHVLYFHQHFTTPKGAGGTRSYEMSQALLKKGHKVTLVCGSRFGANTEIQAPFVKGKRTGTVDGIDIIELELEYSNKQAFIKC